MDQLREHVGKMRDLKKTRIGQLGEMQIELDHLCKVLEDEPQSGKRRIHSAWEIRVTAILLD